MKLNSQLIVREWYYMDEEAGIEIWDTFKCRVAQSVFSCPLEIMHHCWCLRRIQRMAVMIAANVCIQQFQYNLCCTFVHFFSPEISSSCILKTCNVDQACLFDLQKTWIQRLKGCVIASFFYFKSLLFFYLVRLAFSDSVLALLLW